MHFQFQTRGAAGVFKGPCELHLRNGVLPRGITAAYGNVPRAAVAFAVPPTPVSSSRCKGGSCSSHLQDRQVFFTILDDSSLARPLKQHTEKPRPPVSLRSGLRDLLKSPLPVDMRTVASAAGYVPLFTAPLPGCSISLKTRH